MIQMCVNFYLPSNLTHNVAVHDLLLRQHLNSNDELVLFLAGEVDMTEPMDERMGYFPLPRGRPISKRERFQSWGWKILLDWEAMILGMT